MLARDLLNEYSRTYTLEELRNQPKHLDQTILETYLSDTDFQQAFGTSKQEFAQLPQWKRQEKKKALGLF